MGTREYPWVSKYPWITRIEIPARIWGRARVPYLSNGAGTDMILPVSMDTHWYPYFIPTILMTLLPLSSVTSCVPNHCAGGCWVVVKMKGVVLRVPGDGGDSDEGRVPVWGSDNCGGGGCWMVWYQWRSDPWHGGEWRTWWVPHNAGYKGCCEVEGDKWWWVVTVSHCGRCRGWRGPHCGDNDGEGCWALVVTYRNNEVLKLFETEIHKQHYWKWFFTF